MSSIVSVSAFDVASSDGNCVPVVVYKPPVPFIDNVDENDDVKHISPRRQSQKIEVIVSPAPIKSQIISDGYFIREKCNLKYGIYSHFMII